MAYYEVFGALIAGTTLLIATLIVTGHSPGPILDFWRILLRIKHSPVGEPSPYAEHAKACLRSRGAETRTGKAGQIRGGGGPRSPASNTSR